MKVTATHLEQYAEDGFVVIEGGLSPTDLEAAIQAYTEVVDELARDKHGRGEIESLYENESFGTRLARIADDCGGDVGQLDTLDIGYTRRRGVFELLRNERLADLVEAFVGPEITCNAISHMRPKMPGTDVGFHQDAVFTTPEAHHILQLTVWIPLVEVTPENGCLQIRPGIHKDRVVYWNYGASLPQAEPVTLPMKPGDVLFMHKLAPHGSGPNNTDAVRWSMDLRYQKTGEPSPRPEWPDLIARSRRDPSTETRYEEWRDAWAVALEQTPKQIRYERPGEPRPYTGEMWLGDS